MSRASRLAELRALRASGKTRLSSYQVQDEERLYDNVDEEGYKKVVRARLDQDDFVVDDNGEGYADDGREDWMGERAQYTASESEDELPVKGKAAKRKREEDQEKTEKTNHNINKYFNSGAARAVHKAKPKKREETAEDVAFMADIFNEVDVNVASRRPGPPKQPVKAQNRRKVRVLSPPIENRSKKHKLEPTNVILPDTPPAELDAMDDDLPPPPLDDGDIAMSDPAPSSPAAKAADRKASKAKPEDAEDEEDNDMMEVAKAVGDHAAAAVSVNISARRPVAKEVKKPALPTPESSSPQRAPASDAVDPSAWNDVTAKLNVLSSPAVPTAFGKPKLEEAVEADGSLRFFWMDYTEVNGSLCLFGKVQDKNTKSFVSAFVKVDNILRKLFFLPRTHKKVNDKVNKEEVDMGAVYEEADGLMSKLGVDMHKIKPCERKYAFELPDIPKEAEYLKLMYPYNKPILPMDIQGETFSHVFGTNTALFEQFVLWKNIMGPCWLQIEKDELTGLHNASWCKFEAQVSSPKAITVLLDSDSVPVPPLTVMSMSLRTTLNVKENKQEILVASARIYENFSLTDPTPADKLPCKTFTIMRPAEHAYPPGFEALCKRQRGTIKLEQSEQMLLSTFMAMLEKADPDVLVGHQLQDVDYPVLLSRMRERKTPGWHRIGRLRRSDWPKTLGKGGASFYAERQLVSGRLLCDVANDLGKSLMSKCQSWSLTEMCSLYLGEGVVRQEVDVETALNTWAKNKDGLMNFLSHCEADTHFVAAIAMRVQMLPLSKVLTNLAGNSWARTLSGTRAERNEYILLHEFHKNKYICPDKIWGKNKVRVEENPEDGQDAVSKKKDKFKGGLVFEPEKGLYDRFILVMDFNSLYPSIIQEYNICFTTVDRSGLGNDDEKVPEVPEEANQGILPKLIATLVSRRREVKKLMKNKRASTEDLATWDIKQMALKLTANSMYGCLGYEQSRFYARPLAMLTTSKGREILQSTKALAESTQLQVIYGDTDSVMINTKADSVEEAFRIGNEFKRNVNERYKLLEIDIDNVFKRLLLQAKKKYAAINLLEVDGKYVEKMEVKGLDMRRREYCALSKEASSRILHEILSGEDPETVMGKILEYLQSLAQQMREEKIASQKYIIFTKLGKDPRSYPNADSMPQVQVALRALAAGKSVRINDVISFITTAADPAAPESNPAKRAYAPVDLQRAGGARRPDIDWYLAKQLFPPIERLCAGIPGANTGRLAESLGLDPKRYALARATANGGSSGESLDIAPLFSQLPDAVRFRDCPRLTLSCPACRRRMPWPGLRDAAPAMLTPTGLVCAGPAAEPRTDDDGDDGDTAAAPASEGCGAPLRTLTLVAQVEHAVRALAARYYDGWLACDDAACGVRARAPSVYGRRCLGPQGRAAGCLGTVRPELGGRLVGTTLAYWRGLWDVDRAGVLEGVADEAERERLRALREWNRDCFATVRGAVEAYEKRCGWLWVQMDGLFAFAMR